MRPLSASLDGRVDVLEGVGGDQLVERKTPLPVEIDERRNEQLRNAVALDDAAHRPAEQQANAFNAAFFDKAKGAYYDDPAAGYRQTSNLLPLSLGIVPEAARAGVVANLVGDIKGAAST